MAADMESSVGESSSVADRDEQAHLLARERDLTAFHEEDVELCIAFTSLKELLGSKRMQVLAVGPLYDNSRWQATICDTTGHSTASALSVFIRYLHDATLGYTSAWH